MSYKRATYISLLVCIALAVIFYIKSLELPSTSTGATFGPSAFPKLISALIVIFSFISFLLTKRKEDEKLTFENIKYVIFTIIFTAGFTLLWQLFGTIYGMFYLLLFLFLTTLLFIYNQAKNSSQKVFIAIGVSVVITSSVYIVFERLLKIVFN